MYSVYCFILFILFSSYHTSTHKYHVILEIFHRTATKTGVHIILYILLIILYVHNVLISSFHILHTFSTLVIFNFSNAVYLRKRVVGWGTVNHLLGRVFLICWTLTYCRSLSPTRRRLMAVGLQTRRRTSIISNTRISQKLRSKTAAHFALNGSYFGLR